MFFGTVAMSTKLEGRKIGLRRDRNSICLHPTFASELCLKTSYVRFSTIFPIACLSTARYISAILFSKPCTSLICSLSMELKFSSRIAFSHSYNCVSSQIYTEYLIKSLFLFFKATSIEETVICMPSIFALFNLIFKASTFSHGLNFCFLRS